MKKWLLTKLSLLSLLIPAVSLSAEETNDLYDEVYNEILSNDLAGLKMSLVKMGRVLRSKWLLMSLIISMVLLLTEENEVVFDSADILQKGHRSFFS